MPIPHDLSTLLTALRAEGVPIGPGELTRLAHAFRRGPVLDRRNLRELLACTLIKGADRSGFDTLFDAWCPEDKAPGPSTADEDGDEDEPEARFTTPDPADQPRPPAGKEGTRDMPFAPEPEPEPEPTIPETPETDSGTRRRILAGVFILMGLVVIGALLHWYWPEPPRVEELESSSPPKSQEPIDESGKGSAPSLEQDPIDPVSVFSSWVPKITREQPPRLSPDWIVLFGIAAWLAALWVYLDYRRRRPRPVPDRAPLRRPGRLPLAKAERAEGRLIDTAARRRLVWNIGRFQSEAFTRRIDLAATVQATARAAGVVEIRREQAVYPREIWLWEDELGADPALPALAAELEQELGRAGLVIRRGGFAELPWRVCWSGDDCIRPLMIDGHQRNAMVAVLTDGEGLALALESDLEGRRARGLLAGLRHWPQLVFVDFSDASTAAGRVTGLVAPFGLACIRPEALHHWLGGETVFAAAAGGVGPGLVGDERLWAAACALGGRPLTAEEALTLHGALGLRCPTGAWWRTRATTGWPGLPPSAAAISTGLSAASVWDRTAGSRIPVAWDWPWPGGAAIWSGTPCFAAATRGP